MVTYVLWATRHTDVFMSILANFTSVYVHFMSYICWFQLQSFIHGPNVSLCYAMLANRCAQCKLLQPYYRSRVCAHVLHVRTERNAADIVKYYERHNGSLSGGRRGGSNELLNRRTFSAQTLYSVACKVVMLSVFLLLQVAERPK